MIELIIGVVVGAVAVALYNKFLSAKVDAEVAVVKDDVKKVGEKVEEVVNDVKKIL